MVCALLDGRKTMTRRLLKPQPEQARDGDGNLLPHTIFHVEGDRRPRIAIGRCITRQEIKYAPGDRLWVRESLFKHDFEGWRYSADKKAVGLAKHHPSVPAMISWAHHKEGNNAPSIHMPRWASRLTLIVTATKIERVQDISKADVIAEGITEREGQPIADVHAGWHEPFAGLWTALHGVESWDANPKVVCISFRVVKANIDAMSEAAAA
jgi:hypothetical protein